MDYRRSLTFALCLALLVTVFGCSKKGASSQLDTVPVEGTVSLNGKTYTGPGILVLTPDPANDGRPEAKGIISKTGSFTLFSYKTSEDPDGAPVGKYTASLQTYISDMSMAAVPIVNPVTVDIKKPAEGETVKLKIELTAKKGAGTSTGGPEP